MLRIVVEKRFLWLGHNKWLDLQPYCYVNQKPVFDVMLTTQLPAKVAREVLDYAAEPILVS